MFWYARYREDGSIEERISLPEPLDDLGVWQPTNAPEIEI